MVRSSWRKLSSPRAVRFCWICLKAGEAFSGLLMNSLTVASVRLNSESFCSRISGLSRSILSMI